VDNGYLKWSTTVPPIKLTSSETERRWSHWLESLRKDVECTFGILKGRWRVLKTGIRLEGVEVADKIWKTCCALHNWLLEIDGLDGQWDAAIGQQDASDVLRHLPFALDRLRLGWDPRTYDASNMGPGEDRSERRLVHMETANVERGDIQEEQQGGHIRVVRYLSLAYFRSKLIEHFDILFCRRQLVWPSRRRTIKDI